MSGATGSTGNVFVDNLRRVVGMSYILADSLYGARSYILAEGYKKERDLHDKDSEEYAKLQKAVDGEMGEVRGMGLWAGGGAIMALFGNRSAKKEIKALSNKLAAFLKEEGIELTGEALDRALQEQDKTIFKKLIDFAYRYPSEIMHACFAVGSVGIIKNGAQNKDIGALGMGISVLLGALIGVFVQEKTPEQIAKLPPAKNSFEKIGRNIQLHANKYTSTLYLTNNAFSALRVVSDKKKFNKDSWMEDHQAPQSDWFHNVWKVRLGALATYIFGAGTLRLTKKGSNVTGEEGDLAKSRIFEEAAEMLVDMPDEIRDVYIRKTAEFLHQQRELGMTKIDPTVIAKEIQNAFVTHQESHIAKADEKDWVDRSQNSTLISNGYNI